MFYGFFNLFAQSLSLFFYTSYRIYCNWMAIKICKFFSANIKSTYIILENQQRLTSEFLCFSWKLSPLSIVKFQKAKEIYFIHSLLVGFHEILFSVQFEYRKVCLNKISHYFISSLSPPPSNTFSTDLWWILEFSLRSWMFCRCCSLPTTS